MKLTLYTSNTPIGKKLVDGKIVHMNNLYDGKAEKLTFDTITGLKARILSCGPNSALGFGTYSSTEPSQLITYKNSNKPGITRSKDHFKYRNEPGFLLVDYDPIGKPLSRDQLKDILEKAMPELAKAPSIWKTSSSSCINNNDVYGQHFMYLVKDSREIPRISDILFKRLWLAGYGYIFIDKAGRAHTRSLIDRVVNSPERLCFIRTDVKKPDVQNLQVRYQNESGEPITHVNDLSSDDIILYRQMVAEAKEDAKIDIELQTDAWVNIQTKKHNKTRKEVLQMRNGGVLYDEFEVILQDGTVVTVKEIIDNPDKYNTKRCHDPFEPEYQNYNSTVAYIQVSNATPRILSHAHGGINYDLESKTDIPDEIVEITSKECKITKHPWPPGFIGDFAKEIHKRMSWPHKEISIISARHIVRSLLGRKASFQGISLSQINILLADQGVGKNTPNKVLNIVIEQIVSSGANDLFKAFRGSKGTYGVKALHKKLLKIPSMSVLIPEAGISSKSNSGDVFKVKQYIMQNIVNNAYQPYDVSDFAEALPDAYGVNLSILEESTQTSYIHNFTQDSINSGDESRKLHHFVSSVPDSMPTKYAHTPFDEEILSKLKLIVQEAVRKEDFEFKLHEDDKDTGPCLVNVDITNQLHFKPDDYTTGILQKLLESEFEKRKKGNALTQAERSLFVRKIAQIKSEALLYAYVDFIVNSADLYVKKEHIDYAIEYEEECKRSMQANVDVSSSNDSRLVQAILEFMAEKKDTPHYKKKHNTAEKKHNLFKHSYIISGDCKINTIASEIANVNVSKSKIIQNAYVEGANSGYWTIINKHDTEVKSSFGVDFGGQYLKLLSNVKFKPSENPKN